MVTWQCQDIPVIGIYLKANSVMKSEQRKGLNIFAGLEGKYEVMWSFSVPRGF